MDKLFDSSDLPDNIFDELINDLLVRIRKTVYII